MMGFEMSGGMAARIAAHLVANHQRSALRLRDQTPATAEREHFVVFVNDGAQYGLSQASFCAVAAPTAPTPSM